MRGYPTDKDTWGKFRSEDNGGPAWHPLVDHCIDVACVFEALLSERTIEARLAPAAGLVRFSGVQKARLCWLACLHDLGKANWGFQRKIDQGLPQGDRRGHVKEALAILAWPALTERLKVILDRQAPSWHTFFADPQSMLVASICHHRLPLDLMSWRSTPEPRNLERYWAPRDGVDPVKSLDSLVERASRMFLPADVDASTLPEHPAFQHAFCGLLMLADWIGSSEQFFPFAEANDQSREHIARQMAVEALRAIGIAAPAPADRRHRGRDYSAFDFSIEELNPTQRAVYSLPLSPPPRLVVLEAETGSGKTEAALLHFQRLFEAGHVDGLYFALPTRSSAGQIHDRITRWAERYFPDEQAPAIVAALPGFFKAGGVKGKRHPLASFEVIWDDEPSEAVRQKRWAAEHPKRYMAGQIVVGTIDQALLGNLQVPYAHLRSAALLRHLLVVDEVHSNDDYMTEVLQGLLEAHRAAGGFALLMSATLTAEARARLTDGEALDAHDAAKVRYPLVTVAGAGAHAPSLSTHRKKVRIDLSPYMGDTSSLIASLIEAAQGGGRVLVIRNTVDDAVSTFELLRTGCAANGLGRLLFSVGGVPTLHHGRFAGVDRIKLDAQIEASFGQEGRDGVVAVGTQTLEQSLDIDADLLVTDLCPIDVLLQRIGRLHRHPARQDRAGLEAARCIVLTPADRDLSPFLRHKQHGLGSVYRDLRTIETTWRTLEASPDLDLPSMNRRLVESALHPAVLDAIARELGCEWVPMAQDAEGRRMAERQIARLHMLDRRRPFGTFTFASVEERVTTRLGADDQLVEIAEDAETAPIGPFGEPITELKVPARFLQGAEATEVIQTVRVTNGFSFGIDSRQFVYDNRGLQLIK